jgi:hypothetical protein
MVPAVLLSLSALLLFACGGGDDDPATTPPPPEDPTAGANPADVKVIDAWVTTLRKGDVNAAAEFFAIPSIAENGPTVRITNRAQARLFNASLPCGAVLVSAESQGAFTTATFRLTERPGPGVCGDGVGEEAQTAFVIEGGQIVEWRRVAIGGPQAVPGEAV